METIVTMDELIRNHETRLRSAEADHKATRESLTDLRARVEDGYAPSEGEVTRAIQAHEAAADRRDALRAELENLRAEQAKDLEVQRMQNDTTPTGVSRGGIMNQTGKTYVVSEPSQYSQHAERTGEASFLQDLYASQIKNDPQAGERLSRHGREVEATMNLNKRVGTTTTTIPSFVPPSYLVDLFAEFARAARPMANLLTSLPLPPTGMTITVPKVTTPSSVAVQGSENVAVAEAAMVDTPLELDVITCGGFVPVSRQSLERGVAVEEMIFGDLASAYASQLDTLVVAEALGQSGTNNEVFTATAPTTVTALWPHLAAAVGAVRSLRFRGPTAIVMRPDRWAWCLAALSDDDDRPLFPVTAANPVNAMGTQSSTEYDGAAGQVLGVPVYLDGNIPTNMGSGTNEDSILIADFRDHVLLEEPNRAPVQLKFEAAGGSTLTVNLVAYGYSAFTFGRQPAALSKVTGSGMAAV